MELWLSCRCMRTHNNIIYKFNHVQSVLFFPLLLNHNRASCTAIVWLLHVTIVVFTVLNRPLEYLCWEISQLLPGWSGQWTRHDELGFILLSCFISFLHFLVSFSRCEYSHCTLWWMQSIHCNCSTLQEKVHVSNRFTNFCQSSAFICYQWYKYSFPWT